jgi:hypothetical protein
MVLLAIVMLSALKCFSLPPENSGSQTRSESLGPVTNADVRYQGWSQPVDATLYL